MSTTTGWHAPPELLRAYLDGRLDAVLSASLERHVGECGRCREAILPLSDPALLDAAWAGVRERVESPRLPWLLRVAGRLGLREATGVLLAAAASLRVAWLSGALVALFFAAIATVFSEGTALWPFLLVAPLIPVLGVASAYGPAEDPFEALAVSTPYGRTRLILVRTLAVLLTTLPGACLLGLALPGPTWVAAAWLGPALAMIPLLLAISSFVGPRLGAAVLILLWAPVVVGSSRRLPATWPVEGSQQVVYLGLALAAGAVLLVRSHRTRRIGAAL